MTARIATALGTTWEAITAAWSELKGSTQWNALGVFVLRAASAGLLFVSQIALARWMGAGEYGIFVSAWTCVLVLGGLSHLGLNGTMMRLVPRYAASGAYARLRGLLFGGRIMTLISATAIAATLGLGLWLLGYEMGLTSPLTLALLCLPLYAIGDVQDGLGRGSGWTLEAIIPPYIFRPLLLLILLGALHASGLPTNASSAMMVALFTTAAAAVLQTFLIERRIRKTFPRGREQYAFASWLKMSLPLVGVGACEVIIQNADVLLLNMYRPPAEIGVYYAAAKTTALALFVQYAIGTAYSGRIAAASTLQDRTYVQKLISEAVRWTFLPTLMITVAILLVGYPLLAQFGEGFTDSYPLMFILAVGVLARSSVGPSEILLSMLGRQRACATSYAIAAIVCVGLHLLLIPHWGVYGASVSSAAALMTLAALNWYAARKDLGLDLFVLSNLKPLK